MVFCFDSGTQRLGQTGQPCLLGNLQVGSHLSDCLLQRQTTENPAEAGSHGTLVVVEGRFYNATAQGGAG